jgi:hypothetical protein
MVSFTSGLVARFAMQIEEKGLGSDEVIPEERRALMLDMKFKQEGLKRTLQIGALKGTREKKEVVTETWEWHVQDTPCVNNGLHVVALGLKVKEALGEVVELLPKEEMVIPQEMDPAEIENTWRTDVTTFKAV